jgi:hypothetical protein
MSEPEHRPSTTGSDDRGGMQTHVTVAADVSVPYYQPEEPMASGYRLYQRDRRGLLSGSERQTRKLMTRAWGGTNERIGR